jgi:hypothetical protein
MTWVIAFVPTIRIAADKRDYQKLSSYPNLEPSGINLHQKCGTRIDQNRVFSTAGFLDWPDCLLLFLKIA